MKFISNKDDLLTAVSAVSRAVSPKATMPVLSGIYMEAEGDTLRFIATDMELGIEFSCKVSVEHEGSTVVNGRIFSEVVRRLVSGPVTFELDGQDSQLHIKYQGSELNINTMNPQEFPLLPAILDGERLVMKVKQFKEMNKLVSFAAHTDETRPWFTGVLWDIEDDYVRWVATDTHRMAMYADKVDESGFSGVKQVILHAKTLSDVAKLFSEEEDTITFTFTRSQVLLESGNMRVIMRIIEGQYPKYSQVIPNEFKTRVTLSTSDLTSAIERASLASLGKEGSNIVKIASQGNLITIRSNSPEVGHIYEEIFSQIEGEPIPIAFNYRYLLDVLKVIGADEINIDLSGSLSPGVIRPIGQDNYLYLIVPVRTV